MKIVADLGLGHVRIPFPSEIRVLGEEYGPSEGSEPLRRAVASWEGVPIEEVGVTTGASLGLVSTLALLDRPCCMLCPRPFYPAYPKVADCLGIDVVYYDLEKRRGWQPDPQKMAALVRKDTRALLLNFPGNPTGTLPAFGLLEELKRIVQDRNLLVISDEVYSDLLYDGSTFPDMRSLFGRNRVVRLRSFSKVFGIPGERLGYVIADPSRRQAIGRAHWSLAMSPPATAQAIALQRLGHNPGQRLDHLREALTRARQRALSMLAECDRLRSTPPAGGIFCWIEALDCGFDSRKLAGLCADKGVLVVPGAAFGVADGVYLRVSFAVEEEVVARGFELLVRLIQGL